MNNERQNIILRCQKNLTWENSKMSNEENVFSRLILYIFDRVKIERCTEHVRMQGLPATQAGAEYICLLYSSLRLLLI